MLPALMKTSPCLIRKTIPEARIENTDIFVDRSVVLA